MPLSALNAAKVDMTNLSFWLHTRVIRFDALRAIGSISGLKQKIKL
jgi:hypothetical protein